MGKTFGSISLASVALALAATTTFTDNASAATVQWLKAADFAIPNVTNPTRLSVDGISQDGSTLYGTIRLVTGSSTDRGYYYRNGILTTIEGLGAQTRAAGISADGKTLVGQATKPSPGGSQVMYVTDLGGSSQATTFIDPPAGLTNTTITGSGTPLSANGKVVGLSAVTSGTSSTNRTMTWSPIGGLSTTLIADTIGSGAVMTPTAVSADGSVFAGGTLAYRVKNGSSLLLNDGVNNTGNPVLNPRVISADGNTIAVSNGLWHENTTNAPNFQNFQAIPGYVAHTGIDTTGGGFSLTTATIASSELSLSAMTPDASFAAGSSNSGIASDAWIWSAETNTTTNISDFLLAHGVDLTGSIPTASNPNDSFLYSITGLALNNGQLTIVGVGDPNSNRNGWMVTVAVPEPATFGIGGMGTIVLATLRRHRR